MHDANDVESVEDDFYSGETEDTPMDYYCSDYDHNNDEDAEDDDDANFDFVEDDMDDYAEIASRRPEVNPILILDFLFVQLKFATFNEQWCIVGILCRFVAEIVWEMEGKFDPLVMGLLLFDPFMAKVILVSLSKLTEEQGKSDI